MCATKAAVLICSTLLMNTDLSVENLLLEAPPNDLELWAWRKANVSDRIQFACAVPRRACFGLLLNQTPKLVE